MADIFQEVDDALQQEKVEKFWHENKSTIVLAIIVLIASTGATSFYKSWNANRNQTETAALMMALESKTPAENLATFAKGTRSNHQVIAQMGQAALHLQKGEKDQAADIYLSIAKQKNAPDNFRDLARILAVRYNLNDETVALIKPLLKNQGSPFHWHALIEMATYEAHQKQNYAAAISLLDGFNNNNAIPASLSQQAESLREIYTLKSNQNNG